MAYALPFLHSGPTIHIFADRIRSGRNSRLTAALLGLVLAHEIAHVLEGTDRHSTAVMKPHFNREDVEETARRPLAFAAEDVALIHMGMWRAGN